MLAGRLRCILLRTAALSALPAAGFSWAQTHVSLKSSMPALKKQRYELFCIGIAKGLTPAESYTEAGYSGQGASASAIRLLRKAEVAQRLEELKVLTANRAAGIPDTTQMEVAIQEHIANKAGQLKLKAERHKKLCQIAEERAAHYSDPNNQMVRRLTGTAEGQTPDLTRLPGIATGFVTLHMKMLGKTAVPVLELDTPLLRELSSIEREVGLIQGFLDGYRINVDARQQQVNVDNRTQVQIVKMVASPGDEKGQW